MVLETPEVNIYSIIGLILGFVYMDFLLNDLKRRFLYGMSYKKLGEHLYNLEYKNLKYNFDKFEKFIIYLGILILILVVIGVFGSLFVILK